jgi:hypothetical protein
MTETKTEKTVKAHDLLGAIVDISIGLLFAAIMLGKVALPTFYGVTTGTFDSYTLLIWGLLPLGAVAAVLIATFNRAKYAYALGGQGGFSM